MLVISKAIKSVLAMQMTPATKLVYMALAEDCTRTKKIGTTYRPVAEHIAKHLDINPVTYWRSIKELEENNLLEVDRSKKPFLYLVKEKQNDSKD